MVHMKFKCRQKAAGDAVIDHAASKATERNNATATIGYVSCYVFVFQQRSPDKPLAER